VTDRFGRISYSTDGTVGDAGSQITLMPTGYGSLSRFGDCLAFPFPNFENKDAIVAVTVTGQETMLDVPENDKSWIMLQKLEGISFEWVFFKFHRSFAISFCDSWQTGFCGKGYWIRGLSCKRAATTDFIRLDMFRTVCNRRYL
jgi:hypothetical protein